MNNRIERNPAEKSRRRIAQLVGRPGVRTLMDTQGENENKELNKPKNKVWSIPVGW